MNKYKFSFITAVLTITSTVSLSQVQRLRGIPGEGIQTENVMGTIVADPGFESGTPNVAWQEASSNFGTPICDTAACGTGGGTGPNSGSFWAWFGGFSGGLEEGSVSQQITIPPAGTATLSFEFEAPVCDGTGFFEVLINNNQEHFVDQTSTPCGVVGYSTIDIDITAYQGQTVDLVFHSITQGDDIVNFFVDDVFVTITPPTTYTVGGNLTGLLFGNEVTLQNNLGDDLLLQADGNFVFSTELNDMDNYDVTVFAHPVSPSQTCMVVNGQGSIQSADVTNINVSCDNLDLIFRNGFE